MVSNWVGSHPKSLDTSLCCIWASPKDKLNIRKVSQLSSDSGQL